MHVPLSKQKYISKFLPGSGIDIDVSIKGACSLNYPRVSGLLKEGRKPCRIIRRDKR